MRVLCAPTTWSADLIDCGCPCTDAGTDNEKHRLYSKTLLELADRAGRTGASGGGSGNKHAAARL